MCGSADASACGSARSTAPSTNVPASFWKSCRRRAWSCAGGVPEEQGRVSRVELHVRPDGAGTELILIHAGLSDAESARSHKRGWGGALDKLCRRWTA
jgi:hypothetical protein